MSLPHAPRPVAAPPRADGPPAPPLRLAVVDMSGTSIVERGLQDAAFAHALETHGLAADAPAHADAVRVFRARRATSRTAVFAQVFPDRPAAAAAARTFEEAFDSLLAEHGAQPVPGAEEALLRLRALGLRVCLCTGYARHTQNMILESLGWMGLADLSLSPDDAGRGVPFPDMILTALLGLDLDDVRGVLVVGDTAEDMTAGRRAGAGLVAGVRTGRDADAALLAAGAHHVVDGLADVPALVGAGG
ncbi:HAD family hydrolase [Micrococcus endophyticus]|uniref:HAD family hydrolase n=1 Tax=Micrococcus endophyticus TaxID=455343 RepID=UPI0035A912A6